MNNKKTLVLLILLVAIIVGAAVAYNYLGDRVDADNLAQNEEARPSQTQSESQEAETSLAPDFTVTDLEGNSVKLSDFRGKPVVVNFWASWCGPCKMEMPDFQQAFETYGEEISFLMVNMTDNSRETVEVASELIEGEGYTFPVYYDTSMDAAMVYGVSSIPQTFFITADGKVGAYAQSMLDLATIEKGINMIK